MLALSWIGSRKHRAGATSEVHEPNLRIGLRDFFPAADCCNWVFGLAAVVVAMSLVGIWEDPWRPWLSAAVVLSLSALFGAMALWTGMPAYVTVSGLLFSIVAFLIWQAGRPAEWFGLLSPFDQFLSSQALALAAASAVWSIVGILGERRGVSPTCLRTPFAQIAGVLALLAVAVLAMAGLGADLATINYRLPFPLAWWALAITGVAITLTAWSPTRLASMPMAPLYLFGLVTIGLALHW